MRQFGNRSSHLDPGWPCPHQHKRQECLAFLWIRFDLGGLKGEQDLAAEHGRIIDRLESGRERFPRIIAKVAMARACGDNQVIIGHRTLVHEHALPPHIHASHLGQDHRRVFLVLENTANGGTPRLYEERFGFPDGRARFHPIAYIPPAEEPDDEYPLILTTGRVIYHYLSGNQTRRTPFLQEMAPYPWVEIHEQTATRLGIVDGDWVTVRTRRGEMTAPALVVRSIRPDTLFIPYHYGHTQAVNILTNPVLEPMLKIPEYKVCACCAVRAEQAPDWAKGETLAALSAARKRRHELPIAQEHPTPTFR